MDFNVFLNKDINQGKCDNIRECKSTERVMTALLYYEKLNKTRNENSNGQSIFSSLLIEAYTHYLDDITHVMTAHSHSSHLSDMHTLLSEQGQFEVCNIDECLLSDRHCQINDGKNGNIAQNRNDELTAFHEQTWDNIHFYFTHLFEIGMREIDTTQDYTEQKMDRKTETAHNNEDKWGCFEAKFKRQRTMIESKRKRFPRFSSRFKPVSNKFIIQTIEQTQSPANTNGDSMFYICKPISNMCMI